MTISSRFAIIVPAVIFFALAAAFYAGLRLDTDRGLPSGLVGNEAPALDLDPLGGTEPPSSQDLQSGGIKLVNYWASWCAPCRAEHPNLMALSQSGVTILGANYKDDAQDALGFLDELDNPFEKFGADKLGRTAVNWGVYGIPETFVVDGEGIVLLRHAGPITGSVLRETILPAIRAVEEN